mmetsp:Transcript_16777/g.24828  ORF Transcript_16777/g.24828 Transcript_16777/m.24828 type:complete len:109 (+) Transcript_16777:264-590(+)
MGREVGVKGVVVAPREVQEYLGAVGLNSMEVVRAIGRRRRIAAVVVSEDGEWSGAIVMRSMELAQARSSDRSAVRDGRSERQLIYDARRMACLMRVYSITAAPSIDPQ